MPLKKSIVVALDGPAASGKGTLARKLADHFNLALLDTGALYRAVGLTVIKKGGNPENEADALNAAKEIGKISFKSSELRSESIGSAASKVAAIPAVRQVLIDFQRHFAAHPPEGKDGTILDGRDIGTVICPQADVKIFITANTETRAKRRFIEEFGSAGTDEQYKAILKEIQDRDLRDTERATSPLKQAENAYLIDTSNSDIEAVFETARKHVLNKITTS
ncbi:MAG: (d)CMP kinase [Proteobacteria bacterium]|jgi:CMP/dCMP kinase|nr:(d)CMP kinase [Pseudomonadota bacterium]